ncbi:hypothetical protein EJB05_05110, partial [Eragrostis curvula]
MAAEESRAADDARMKLTCSHGGRLVPCAPDGALRYVGGETRVLAVPRSASFHDLTTRLSEMAGGAEVRAVTHRLADAGLEDVIVSVTCDEELAHMRDEYDSLRATRPAARFRVFVVAATSAAASSGGSDPRRASPGLPPLARRCGACRASRRSSRARNCTGVVPPIRCRSGGSRARRSLRGRPSTTTSTAATCARPWRRRRRRGR